MAADKLRGAGDAASSLFNLVENAHRVFEAQANALLEPLDLNTELLKVLYVIDGCDGGTIGRLLPASGLEPDKFAAAVRSLQLRGFVTRPRPKEDPETTIIRFTTQGRLKARRAHAAIERLQERAVGWVGPHQEPLLAALRRLSMLPPP